MKRVLVIILCLVMVGTSVSIPKRVYADSTEGDIQISTSTGFCNLGDTIGIEVNDQDLNTNSAIPDSYTVTVSSTLQVGEQEQLLEEINVDLSETDAGSGKFVGNVVVSAATGSAIGVKEILAVPSGKVTAKYNDSGMWKSASITLEAAMLSGTVSNPDGSPATGGNIEVVKTVDGQAPEFLKAYPINPDGGIYQLPRLVEGSYSIRAYQPDAADHMGSQWLEINVDANGICSDKDGLPISMYSFVFQEVLFSGTVRDKDTITLLDNEFHLELRSLDKNIGHNLRFDWESRNGVYRIATLDDGEYALRAVSQKEGSADSCELYFKIENGTITDPGTGNPLMSFDLQLTAPQVRGTVYYSGENPQPVANSGVVVFDAAMRYVYSKQTDELGRFSIGGLMPGYKLQASVYGHEDYFPENTVDIGMDEFGNITPANANLFLKKKEATVTWIEPFVLHFNDIGIHLNNINLLNVSDDNLGVITATISGNGLVSEITLPCTSKGNTWKDGVGEYFFQVDNSVREQLNFGQYTIVIKNDGSILPSNNNKLDVIQQLQLIPGVAELSRYQNEVVEFDLNVDEINNVRRYPWNVGELLTVRVIKADDTRETENLVTVTVPEDKILPLALQAHTGAEAGRRDIEVYRGTQLIAHGGFDVGVSTIGFVTANEGSDEAALWGDYLGGYLAEQTRAELWLDGVKKADSIRTDVRGDVRFKFDYTFKTGMNYSLKVFVNGEEKGLPGGGVFNVVPRLDWSNADFTSNVNKSFTIKESNITNFGWSTGDNLRVNIYGPGSWDYSVTNGVNLEVMNDSLVLHVTDGAAPGRAYHLDEGEFFIAVNKTVNGQDIPVGFANVIIAYDTKGVLRGTVLTSDGANADGGYIDIGKEGDGWGTRLNIGHDGSFYAFKYSLRGSGDYFLTATPSETSTDAPARENISVTDDDFSSFITIHLKATQVTGTVYAGSEAVKGGYVEVHDPSQGGELILNSPISLDGTYKLGGLVSGKKYDLIAWGPWELDYLCSDWMEITYQDSTLSGMDFHLAPHQINGVAMDGDHSAKDDGGYDLIIRSISNQDGESASKSVGENFLIGRLKPGTYGISIAPRDESEYAKSFETIVTIDNNGVATPDNITLEFAPPMLTGSVKDKDGALVTTDGYVEVWEDRLDGSGYIYSIPLVNGTYKAGGLNKGVYKIRAGAADYTELFNTNSQSNFIKVTLGDNLSTQDLNLTDRSIPRMMWVNDAHSGYNRINARIMNYKSIDMNSVTAEIVNPDGTSLNPAFTISSDKIEKGWYDERSDEADFEFIVDERLRTISGKYLLKLTYSATDGTATVINDQEGSNAFAIAYPLGVQPRGMKPADTPGMSLKLYVDNFEGGYVPNLWDGEDTLTAKLTASNGKVYSDLLYTDNKDNTLTITLPSVLEGGMLSEGWSNIELYKAGELLALGGLQVGVPEIEVVEDTSEGSDRISVRGLYLEQYDNQQTIARILGASDQILWESNGLELKDDRLEFRFEGLNLPAGEYKFSLISGNQVITTRYFYIAPWVICTPHAIATGSSAQLIVKKSSEADLFKWSQNDSIDTLKVRIGGPAHWYEIDSSNGLSFDGDNLKVNISGSDGELLLSETGYCWLEVYKNDRRIGYSNLTIGQDAITATVKDPDGQVVANARVRVTNLNDNSSNEYTTDIEGKFYVSKQDLPGSYDDSILNGDYSFLIMAPAGSSYATTLTIRNINAEINNDLALVLAKPQITGVVKAGTIHSNGGAVEIQKQEGDHWRYLYDFNLNQDGIFRIGGLEDGTYFIRARENDENKDYVNSDFVEVQITGTSVSDITLNLNPVQIRGIALDPAGEPLQGDQFFVNIRPLDQKNKDNYGEWRTEGATFRIGALKPGNYAISLRPYGNSIYTQSLETLITVTEDGTVAGGDLSIKLTEAMFTGNVKAGNESFRQGYVDVFNGTWQRTNYVTTVELDENGNFRIGGIPKGTYFIRAAIRNESNIRETYSQSVMTEIKIGTDTEVQLYLVDNVNPRIRVVNDAGIGDDRISVHIVNLSGIEDFNKLKAQILDENGNAVGDPITGDKYFFVDNWYDYDKDEGNLCIRIVDNIQLAPGKYNLELSYYNDTTDKYEVLQNETPIVLGFNGFNVVHNLDIRPYAAIPEETGGKILELGIYTDNNEYQWPASDRVAVRMYYQDGSLIPLEETIAADNTMTVNLPVQGLAYGNYPIMVYVDGQLLARSEFVVGYPRVDGVWDITEEQQDVRIYGENLIIYMDDTTKVEIYNATGTELLLTNKPWFDGDIVIGLNGKNLPVGDYILKLYYKNGQEVILPNNGKFKSVDILTATPSYYVSNATMGKTITLKSADGSNTPWNIGDNLRIHIHLDWSDRDYVITPDSGKVLNDAVTFTIPENLDWKGHCSITIYKVDNAGDEIYVGYAHFNLINKEQLTGTIFDTTGKPAPYSFVYLMKNGEEWYTGFDADANGNFGIYDVEPGEYTVYAAPPKGLTYMDSDGVDIVIDDEGNCNTVTHNFTLKPGRRISGTISLPNGINAPTDGLVGWIAAWNDNDTPDNGEDDQSFGGEFRFEGGAHTTDYSIIVSNDFNAYYVQTWCEGLGLMNTDNLYSDNGSVDTRIEADMVDVTFSDRDNINLQLRQGNSISGTVSLPSGVAPAGGIEVEVNVNDDKDNDDYKDDLNGGIRVTIPEGGSSAEYTIFVAPSDKYTVEYKIDPKYLYLDNGFYQTSTTTAYDRELAVEVNGTTDPTGIDLTLIPAKIIEGTISLPLNYTLPEGGVNGFIAALIGMGTEDKSDDQWRGTGFEIISGTSTKYAIKVPAGWDKLSIDLWSDSSDLVNCTTFYSINGSVFNQKDATLISLDYDVNEGININLAKGKSITGTITLPSAAPQGGRTMIVQAIKNNGTLNKNDDIIAERKVTFAEGQTSATYTVYVPAMDGYKVNYSSDPAYLYENIGFYSTQGTVFDFNKGAVLNASDNVSGIDLTVSLLRKPICDIAETTIDGTSVQLNFSKPLDVATLSTVSPGFTVQVGTTSYDIDTVTLNEKGDILTLRLKTYKIFKDYKDIKVTYDAAAGIMSMDGMKLDGFEKEVINKSTKEFSILTNFVGNLLNKNAVINVVAAGEDIEITDKGVIIASGTGSISKEISTESTHEVVISIAGRKQKTNYGFTIDKTAPDVTISSPANATVLKNNHDGITPVITFGADTVASTRMISLNGGALSAVISNGGLTYTGDSIREAGHYVLTATAKDAAGNIKTVSSTFDILWDNSSPVITINGVVNGGTYETATITVSLTTDSGTPAGNSNQANYAYKASLKLPTGNIVTKENGVPALTGPGAYRLEIVATNPGYTDITSSKVVEFVIDNTAPVASVEGITNNAIYNFAVTPILGFTDDVTSQQLLLANAVVTLTRGGANVTYHAGDTISLDGEYVLTVKTKDSMNHVSNIITRSFTIDKTKPVISMSGILNGATFKDQNVTLTIKTNEGTLTVTDGAGETVTLNLSGQHTFTGTANQVVTYKVIAKAVDAAGNSTEQQLSFSIDRLAVNIVVNGVTEGMLTKSSPEITFTTLEGTQEKPGTTVTIDGVAFTGGSYSVVGTHTLIAKYVSGDATYTKTIHFTIDQNAPAVSVSGMLKNGSVTSANIIAKAGDTITVRAKVTDLNGIGDVALTIGTANVLMNYVAAEDYYEGKYIVESGNFDSLSITVSAKDKAGNSASQNYSNKLTIDNTKPLVSLYTNPAVADGNNGIFKSPTTKVTLTAGENDTIYWNLNGSTGSAVGSKELTPSQGTNVLAYYAMDQAGNVSDEKINVFAFDSIRPADVTLSSLANVTTSMEYVRISGTVTGEGSTTGTKVLLKKSNEIVAKASIKAGGTFDFDGIKLTEGLNTFSITAIDLAGNQSQNAVTLTRTLDSTVPVLQLEKTDDTHYTITSNENITKPIVKFNGDVILSENVTAVPVDQQKIYHVTTTQPVEGTNVLNVTALDEVGNIGTGSFTSTYIPPNTAQNGLPLNDNATMDIPDDAFGTSTQILVKTVDVNGITNYKPLGAAISFDFKDDQGTSVEPTTPLLIRNYIGVGLNGVVLMHVNEYGVVDKTLTAKVIMSTDSDYQTTMDNMKVDDPYYVSDMGYLIFKTTNFSSYQVAQDNIAPVLTVTTSDYEINIADKTAGGMRIAGTITDTDPNVAITQVLVDGISMDLSGIAATDLDESFSIALELTNGEHEVTIKASDAAGNTTTVIRNYQVDITSPSLIAVASVTDTNRNSVDLSINTGENAQIFINGVSKGQLNGGGILVFDLTDNAVNSIYISASDTFGNTTEAPVIRVTRDSTAPEITITGVNNGDVYGNNVTIGVSATDAHTPNTSITMDGSNYNPGVFSTEGQHTLMVSSTDSYGNTSSRTVVFTIDKSVPVINVTGADNNGKYNVNKTLSITADNIDELIITKAADNQTPENVNTTVTGTSASASVSLGAAGEQHTYTIVITAKKTVGGQLRKANSTISLTVDRKNPVITSTTTPQTENSTINLTGTIDEAANIYLDNDLKITGNPAGSFSITGQNLVLGSNIFHIKAVDMAGNETLFTISITRTAPVNNGGGIPGGIPGGAPGGVVPSEGNKEDETKPETPTETDGSDNATEDQAQIISEKPEKKGSIATATTTNTELSTAIADTEKDTNGVKTVTIELQEVKGAKTYTEVLPVKAMTDGGKDLNVQIVTPLGTVTVPGDMFASKATNQKNNIGISITTADKSKLKGDTLKAIGNKPVIQLSAAVDGKAVTWSNPNAPVTVAIPYTPTAAELKNPDHIVVWYIDGAGKVQTVASGKYDAKTGTVTFTTTHFSTYAVAYVKKSFKDISKLEAKTAIEFVASKGIMNGNTDTKFDPNGTVTKGDFITYLMNTLSLTAEFSTNFADVKVSNPNYIAIGAAKKLGILSGTSKSKFYPNELITKEEMAVYTVLAMKLSQKTLKTASAKDISKYSDAYKVSGNAVNSIAKLVKSDILRIDGKKIYSKDNLTRAEVAEILYRIYKAE